ncbi:MAG: sulfotransferase [Pirellulales bacterium]|nr:sulfotransferase [Pirellulales bacterium]
MSEVIVKSKRAAGQGDRWYHPRLWHSMGVSAWWRMFAANGFRASPHRWPTVVSIAGVTAFNSLMGLVQAITHGRRVARTKVERDPIFIIGHWRSGTTHLHDLLSLDERFAFPTTYECFAPQHFLLTDPLIPKMFPWMLPSKRPMDNMAVGFERPQEDEFALVALGLKSPYWSMAYPNKPQCEDYLRMVNVPAADRRKWKETFDKFLRRLTYRRGGKRIIFKSPTHTARLALLAEMFPQARFLHIVRDPHTLFASTVNLWRKVYNVHGMEKPRFDELEEYIFNTLVEMYRGFDDARDQLSVGQFHQVHYEDLAQNPLPTLEASYDSLDLGGFVDVKPQLERYLSGLRDYKPNEYELSKSIRATISEKWGPIFRPWGYELAEEAKQVTTATG